MAEYASMFAVSCLAAILFFGGWNGPIPVASLLSDGAVAAWLGNFLGMLNLIAKGFFGVTVMIWVRWSLPRFRIDKMMYLCYKVLLPWSVVCLLGVGLQVLLAHSLGGARADGGGFAQWLLGRRP